MTSEIKGSEKNTNHKTHTYYGTHAVTVCRFIILFTDWYYELNNSNVYGSCLQSDGVIMI